MVHGAYNVKLNISSYLFVFVTWLVKVEFSLYKVALQDVYLLLLQYTLVSIVPLMLHIHVIDATKTLRVGRGIAVPYLRPRH